MASRIATSIVALAALLAGTISPIGACALMCERHSRAGIQHHCDKDSDSMPGIARNHSGMHHSDIGDITLVVAAQSCRTDCAVGQRLSSSRKVVPQVTVVQTGAVVLDATSKCLAPHLESEWNLDSGPPSFPSAHTATYSILRI